MIVDWEASDKCAVIGCNRMANDLHHIVHGNKFHKKFSEENGLLIPMCRDHHYAVHHAGTTLDQELKQEAQARYEKAHSRSEWMAMVGKNYREV